MATIQASPDRRATGSTPVRTVKKRKGGADFFKKHGIVPTNPEPGPFTLEDVQLFAGEEQFKSEKLPVRWGAIPVERLPDLLNGLEHKDG